MKSHSGTRGYRRFAAVALIAFFGAAMALVAGCSSNSGPASSSNDGALSGTAACAGANDPLNSLTQALTPLTSLLTSTAGQTGPLNPSQFLGPVNDVLGSLANSALPPATLNSIVDQLTPLLGTLNSPALPIQPSALTSMIEGLQLTDLQGQLNNLIGPGSGGVANLANLGQYTCIATSLLGIGTSQPGLNANPDIVGILTSELGLPTGSLTGASGPLNLITGLTNIAANNGGSTSGIASSLTNALNLSQLSSLTNLLGGLAGGSSPVSTDLLSSITGQLQGLLSSGVGGGTTGPLGGVVTQLTGILSGATGGSVAPGLLGGLLSSLQGILGGLLGNI
ncbi:MAG: hypothetical protein L0H29_07920 [Sinobacteraceae bacterium]|nr:hypothetical protein [Nevskiaceae bacterium]